MGVNPTWSPTRDANKESMLIRNISFREYDESVETTKLDESTKEANDESFSFKPFEPKNPKLKLDASFFLRSADLLLDDKESSFSFADLGNQNPCLDGSSKLKESTWTDGTRNPIERAAAAVTLQKTYKSYRTRRNLADCAVLVEELWWKALDFAALDRASSVSFFKDNKHETAVSRWSRARTRVAKVGKGLSKDEKAQKLALQHWLEAIDPRHRYGHNLHLYYDIWFDTESCQPFFYWLDVGHGKEVNLEKCPRTELQRQCIKYLGPNEREAYEVVVEDGKLVYKVSRSFVDTIKENKGTKWIFVLSTSRELYVGQKKKGAFQHSSFLSGGATSSAGRLVADNGVLKAIWPYSGHYHPTEENFKEFVSFLEEHNVDMSNVQRCAADDDSPPWKFAEASDYDNSGSLSTSSSLADLVQKVTAAKEAVEIEKIKTTFQLGNSLSSRWSTGAGPRIGCVRDYPAELQNKALEQVNLSPRLNGLVFEFSGPIPSPRPSPKIRLSPRLSGLSLSSPKVSFTEAY